MIELTFYLISSLVVAAIWALPAAGVTLVYGVLRYPNFALAEYMTVGTYLTLALANLPGVSIWFAVAGAAILTGILAAAIDQAFFRPVRQAGVLPPILLSLGLMLVLQNVVRFIWRNDVRQLPVPLVEPYHIGGLVITSHQAITINASLLALLVVFAVLSWTRFGKAARATANNPDLALVAGIEPEPVYRGVLFMAGALSALGGIFLGLASTVTPLMGWQTLVPVFAVAILGGLGNVLGTAIAALILSAASEYSLLIVQASYKPALSFLALALVLLVRPAGLLRSNL